MAMKLKSYEGVAYKEMSLDFTQREEVANWLHVELDYSIPEEELNHRIQKAYDDKFNKEAYNSAHSEEKHIDGFDYVKDEEGNEVWKGDLVPDTSQMDEFYAKLEYEETCKKVKIALGDNTEWINIVINCGIDEEPIREYAKRTNQSENAVSHKYNRALKKLEKFFKRPSDNGASRCL